LIRREKFQHFLTYEVSARVEVGTNKAWARRTTFREKLILGLCIDDDYKEPSPRNMHQLTPKSFVIPGWDYDETVGLKEFGHS
jgi:hypothetical protein